jgi:predicted nucleic acid-binding protein
VKQLSIPLAARLNLFPCPPEVRLHTTTADVDELLNAICARAEECQLAHGWAPVLSDPDDEPLVQLTVESGANRVVSHNIRHLLPARTLGIDLLQPAAFLAIIR